MLYTHICPRMKSNVCIVVPVNYPSSMKTKGHRCIVSVYMTHPVSLDLWMRTMVAITSFVLGNNNIHIRSLYRGDNIVKLSVFIK